MASRLSTRDELPEQSEKQLQEQICEYLGYLQWTVWEFAKPGGHGPLRGACPEGWVDLLCVRDDVHVYLELKTKSGTVTDKQRACHNKIEHSTGKPVHIVRSIDDVEWMA